MRWTLVREGWFHSEGEEMKGYALDRTPDAIISATAVVEAQPRSSRTTGR